MQPSILGHSNAIDFPGTVFSCGSQLTSLPVDNLADPDLQVPWVTAGTTTDWVAAVFPSAQALRVIGLAGGLLTSGATVRRRLFSDAPMTTAVYDSGWVPADVADGYWTSLEVLGSNVTARAIRIDISDPARATTEVNGQSAGDLIIGRLIAMPGLQTFRNISWPISEEWIHTATRNRGRRSGAASFDQGPKYRKISFGYEELTEAEARGTFKEFLRNTGLTEQIAFIPDPGGAYQATEAIIGRRAETGPITNAEYASWSHSMVIEEDPALGA